VYENCGIRTCLHVHYADAKQNDVHTGHNVIMFMSESGTFSFHYKYTGRCFNKYKTQCM